ncbi:hypothetical protein BT96DRAFT_983279 [Gymnopus androsaceus JB14]|uniref:Uncharacterized protein n=1 Tax=Gymnopus androsaceus JB14 TaxID=1447944 RepID=A0A6A4IUI9_9AGAR|nr:hypothetical protein BT96DRAFT_983279 [Gymnopus androsaceus JB14]
MRLLVEQTFSTAIAQYPQCSIYFSAFLANLNARHYIRGTGDDMTVSNIEDIHFASAMETRGDAEAGLTTRSRRIVPSQMGSKGDSSGLNTSHHLMRRMISTPALTGLSVRVKEKWKWSRF